MRLRRLLPALLVVGVVVLGSPGTALALTVPTEPPALPPVPTNPIGGEEPSEQPTEAPTDAPTDEPTQDPGGSPDAGGGQGSAGGDGTTTTPDPVDQGTVTVPVPSTGTTGSTTFPTTTTPVPGAGAVDAPEVAGDPSSVPAGTGAGGAGNPGNGWPRQLQLVGITQGTAGALGGVLALALLTVLVGVAVGFQTITLTNRGALVARTLQGEIDMDRTRRFRNVLGVSLLGVAALIGIIGFLRISTETLVPVQVVYLASAGFGVVVFGIAGGSLLVAETLRTDERRVRELEDAIVMLSRHVADDVQDPPRLHRTSPGALDDGDATVDGVTDAMETDRSRADDVLPTTVTRRVVRRRDS